MHARKQGFRVALLAAGIGLLAACGGGGGSGDTPAATVTISGTAAAGAPVIGQVTVKDALGVMRAVDIKSDGSYSVDVTGMQAPFLFRAVGYVGGREVRLTSAATAADINGTINITPFTDLMLANIAGQVASAYFDSGDFGGLTASELNAAKTTLTQRLQPILADLGIDAGFDLLRSAFTADHSGFDAVMDVVRVTVDEGTNTAVIKDIINNTSITDDLTTTSDEDALPTPVTPLATAVSDIAAVDAKLAAFNTLFATGLPSPSNSTLLSIWGGNGSDVSFLFGGADLESFLNQITSDSEMVGARLASPVITERVSDTKLWVRMTFIDKSGRKEALQMLAVKVGDSWLLAGNQHWIDTSLEAHNARRLGYNDDPLFGLDYLAGTTYFRFLETYIDNVPADVEYVRVSGPGLKVNGGAVDSFMQHRSASSLSGFPIMQGDNVTDGYTTWLSECGEEETGYPCIDFSAVTLDSEYTYELLDAGKNPIAGKPDFTVTLPALPVSNASAADNASSWFGKVTAITPSTPDQVADGSTVTATLSLPTAAGSGFDGFAYSANGTWIDAEQLGSGNKVDVTWSGATPDRAEYYLYTFDSANRMFLTIGQHRAPL